MRRCQSCGTLYKGIPIRCLRCGEKMEHPNGTNAVPGSSPLKGKVLDEDGNYLSTEGSYRAGKTRDS